MGELEAKLYKLIEKNGNLAKSTDPKDYEHIEKKISKLSKKVNTFRRELENEITADAKKTGDSGVSEAGAEDEIFHNKIIIDRLEDLQEHVAQLNFAFSEIFESNRAFLVDEVYQQRVMKAQGERNDGLFEL